MSVDAVLSRRAKWHTLVGDVRETLRGVPDGCAQTCVTSPPYFGLRSYDGGAAEIGRETTPRDFADAIVAVMREARRVLRDDGTLWLNLGDSYASAPRSAPDMLLGKHAHPKVGEGKPRPPRIACAAAKQLLGIPWRVAFALQDDGWYLRRDIIWSKPNPMPEPVTDRPTGAHEYVFLLSKRARYFYDAAGIAERSKGTGLSWAERKARGEGPRRGIAQNGCSNIGTGETRNARDVWTIASDGFAEAHFATMPPELARRCILAGSRKGDVVLDPFGGAATTAYAALREGRRALLCELNPDYVEIQRRRLAVFDADAVSPVAVAAGADFGPLFGGGA